MVRIGWIHTKTTTKKRADENDEDHCGRFLFGPQAKANYNYVERSTKAGKTQARAKRLKNKMDCTSGDKL